MNFIAIDFETANEKRASACSLGITVVKDNKIIEEKYWLIKPKPFRFESRNIIIHGIREEDVINEKEFDELWPEIKPYLENNLIIAHNASFDFSVLRNTLDIYNLEYPNLDYACTLVTSKLFYRYLNNHKLNTVNRHLGYRFNHHHASADATAAANILINISQELNLNNMDDIANIIGFKLGCIGNNTYSPCKKIREGVVSKRCEDYEYNNNLFSSETEYFKDKIVVFTGQLHSMSRAEATKIINDLGGITRNSVTKKTNILITNVNNIEDLSPNQMSNKLRTAVNYINQGQDLIIMNEEKLEKILKG
ncbi:exonuclease domain-containing protein [Terrisporobacter vanillatitrophus]|uniref:exonuclease domain-containing protein n=1 Tax=Terrisporobacter vanillatitrophus TaxID=3058402 RepID=UPI0033683D34